MKMQTLTTALIGALLVVTILIISLSERYEVIKSFPSGGETMLILEATKSRNGTLIGGMKIIRYSEPAVPGDVVLVLGNRVVMVMVGQGQ